MLEQLATGIWRMFGLLAQLVANPQLLLLALAGLVLLVYRSSSKADEVRYHRKDAVTLVGLFTTRLAWLWRAPLVAVVLGYVFVARGVGWLVILAAIGLVATRFGARPTWDRLTASERRHQWQVRWSWRWLWACFQGDVLARERWGAQSPYPTVRAVEVRGENAALTVRLPPRFDLKALQTHEGIVGAGLRVKGLRVLPHPEHMGLARVEVLNRALAAGRQLDQLRAPDLENLVTVGYGFDGPVSFDLDAEVGLGVFGATGAGKGILARWLAVQALDPRHGREVWLIDPQGSGEWSPFDGLPGVRRLVFDPLDPMASLQAIAQALDELAADVAERNRVCAVEGVDGWRWLPPSVKRQHPRRLLVVDEVSSLLASVPTSDPTRQLRQAIGTKLGTVYRTSRKAGVGFVHLDQATYGGNETYLGAGAIGQLGRWVALGGMRDETRRMVSGFSSWPYVAPVNGLGLTGRRADEHPEPIEVPHVDRAQVEATLAAWASTSALEARP